MANLWEGLRVALICDYYDPVFRGGAEHSVKHLAAWLSRECHVVVVTPDYRAGPRHDDGPETVRRYPIPDGCGWTTGYWRFANPWWYLYSAQWITELCAQENVAILHCQGKHSLVGTWLAARRLILPCVATMRDYQALCRYGLDFETGRAQWPVTPAGAWYRADAALKRWVLRHYDQVVVLSRAMRDVYAQHGVSAQVIYNTVTP